jgi:hypothetical protein
MVRGRGAGGSVSGTVEVVLEMPLQNLQRFTNCGSVLHILQRCVLRLVDQKLHMFGLQNKFHGASKV